MVDGLKLYRTFVVCRALKALQHLPHSLIHTHAHHLRAEAPMQGANLLIRGDAPHNISTLSQSNNHSHINRANIKSTLGFIILPKGTSTFSQSQGSDCRAPDLWMARSASSQSQQPQIRTSISWDSCAQEYAVQTTMERFKEMSAEYKDGLQCLNLNNSKWKMLQVLFFIWKTYSIQLKLQ